MLYCIETVREVNLAERHNHRIWQAMPVSTRRASCMLGVGVGVEWGALGCVAGVEGSVMSMWGCIVDAGVCKW